jgi:predicted RNA-binding Zn-ribbon protein involved in translation (DUF1610 family)
VKKQKVEQKEAPLPEPIMTPEEIDRTVTSKIIDPRWQKELDKHAKLRARWDVADQLTAEFDEMDRVRKEKALHVDGAVCPVCHEETVERITKTNKVGAAIFFGFFSIGHLAKTFRCQKCGYTW